MKRIALLFSFALAVLSFPQTATCSPSVATSTVGSQDHTNQLTTDTAAPSLQNHTCEVDQPDCQVTSQLDLLAAQTNGLVSVNSVKANPSDNYIVGVQDDHPTIKRGLIAQPGKQNGSAQQITALQQTTVIVLPKSLRIPDPRRQLC